MQTGLKLPPQNPRTFVGFILRGMERWRGVSAATDNQHRPIKQEWSMDCSFLSFILFFHFDYTTEVFWTALGSGQRAGPVWGQPLLHCSLRPRIQGAESTPKIPKMAAGEDTVTLGLDKTQNFTKIHLCPSIFLTLDCSLRGCIRKNWNNTEKISMAPAQGWHAVLEW